jgi:hypothetical protein
MNNGSYHDFYIIFGVKEGPVAKEMVVTMATEYENCQIDFFHTFYILLLSPENVVQIHS